RKIAQPIHGDESDATTHRTPKALRAKFTKKAFTISRSFRSAYASSRRFSDTQFQYNQGSTGGLRALAPERCLVKMRYAATHRHHAGRLRRHRAGDCRSRAKIRPSSEIGRVQDHRQISQLPA